MRSTIELSEKLVGQAQELSGLKTKREVVEAALDEFVRRRLIDRLRARLGRGDVEMTDEELERMRAMD